MNTGQVIVPYAKIQEAYERDPARIEEAVHQGAEETSGGDGVERARLLAAWNNGMGKLRDDDKGESVLSSPQNGLASRLQTLLVQKALEEKKLRVVTPAHTVETDAGEVSVPDILEVMFDNDDFWGWIKMSWKLIFKPEKHAWIVPPAKPEIIADNARIAIFSDWGTALYGAPVIARSVAALDRCNVAMHLGDTYYSGANDEIRDRLVGDWPRSGAIISSRTLNGNHEMYSGGHGYFAAINQKPFNQPASAFAMQNEKWLLICLDTAYVDFNIDQAQVDWVNALVTGAGPRNVVLFSHHQPYSQLDSQGPNLQAALGPLLAAQRVYAWFFGHEHRLVLYDAHGTWGVKARCVGNGGFPAFRDNLAGANASKTQWIRLSPKPGVPAAEVLDGPNPFVTDPERYSPHGYLTLDFAGPQLFETYYSPDGKIVRSRKQL